MIFTESIQNHQTETWQALTRSSPSSWSSTMVTSGRSNASASWTSSTKTQGNFAETAGKLASVLHIIRIYRHSEHLLRESAAHFNRAMFCKVWYILREILTPDRSAVCSPHSWFASKYSTITAFLSYTVLMFSNVTLQINSDVIILKGVFNTGWV